MTVKLQRVRPCFWFDDRAEEAVAFYTMIFPDSSIGRVVRYTKEGAEVAGRPAGSVMSIAFQLDGQDYTALNGGPLFKFSEALSLAIHCETQAEVDHYWERLGEGGDPKAQQCGWLKDQFGVSWQVVPTLLPRLLGDMDPERARRTATAMFKMKKLDIEALRAAAG